MSVEVKVRKCIQTRFVNSVKGGAEKEDKIELQLNKTHKDGDKVVFNDMADYDEATTQGDLIIILKGKPTFEFKRINNDLFYIKTITLFRGYVVWN